MADPLLTSLRRHFGFPAFRSSQHDALHRLLAGHHLLVVMPTGAGKSLIYPLAALHLPGVTLVVSPLVALMIDHLDAVQSVAS
ncbi:MAG: DEAD/DEAH box helicase [Anaerolineae bacterium]|nr:DEAD/DEAH box helicase [Anaerolineae bacterium]